LFIQVLRKKEKLCT